MRGLVNYADIARARGVSRQAVQKQATKLEAAGLIEVLRLPGNVALVNAAEYEQAALVFGMRRADGRPFNASEAAEKLRARVRRHRREQRILAAAMRELAPPDVLNEIRRRCA